MNELSVASSIAIVAERHAAGRRVVRVEVAVGQLRQVVTSELVWAFEMVTTGTALEGAELAIRELEAWGRCRRCRAESPMPEYSMVCPRCGGMDLQVTGGEELAVEALEVAVDRPGA